MPDRLECCVCEGERFHVDTASGAELRPDSMMLATGRQSNTAKLNLEAAGIVPGKYGRLEVDQEYQVVNPESRVPVPGVFAAGDVNARGMIIGDEDGFLKMIFEFNPDIQQPMKLLGVHVIGEIASEIVHIGLCALMMGAGSELFINTRFNFPTLGELYEYAAYDAMGRRAQRLIP